FYRPSKGPAKLIHDVFRISFSFRMEEGRRHQFVVAVIGESRTVKLIRAAFDLHVHGRSSGETLFCVEAVGHNVNRFDRFKGGDVGGDMWQPDIEPTGPVDANIV